MSMNLVIDGARWRAHLKAMTSLFPSLVPVIKGNGYGIGRDRLAHEATSLGLPVVAVGTAVEATALDFAGDILVLSPGIVSGARIISTAATLDQVSGAGESRFVMEILTSVNRHGIDVTDIAKAIPHLVGKKCEGIALHLPLNPRTSIVEEVSRILTAAESQGLTPDLFGETVWVSHCTEDDLQALRTRFPSLNWRPRIGTRFWLGDRGALSVTSTVLDRRIVLAGTRVGYRQRKVRKKRMLLVVSGGTSHGVGLESAVGERTLLSSTKALIKSLLHVFGVQRSPFIYQGMRLRYAEPAHMQCSLLLCDPEQSPHVGDQINVDVRMTTTAMDSVEIR
jgi:hypothetical protein